MDSYLFYSVLSKFKIAKSSDFVEAEPSDDDG